MKEDFLHYVWKNKKMDVLNLHTTDNEKIVLLDVGMYLEQSGPDFFNAQIEIAGQKWAGNVEIHVKSSDWYVHHHQEDNAYDNVILHVVWEHDMDVFRANHAVIPVLELKEFVPKEIVFLYQELMQPKQWINCESEFKTFDGFKKDLWLERLFMERLERKSKPIFELLEKSNQDWELVTFVVLAQNFGLNTNGETFGKIAASIPFDIIRKNSFEHENLEALWFGISGLLDKEMEDVYFQDLRFRYYFLLHQYGLEKGFFPALEFFKHRPDNFPTIRISQLCQVYHKYQNLFSKLMARFELQYFYDLFDVGVSEYWKTHYVFDKSSAKKEKKLSKTFVDLLIINAIMPLQYAYSRVNGKEDDERMIEMLREMRTERNAVLDKYETIGVKAKNAFESQSLLELKKYYCNNNKCLSCNVGNYLMQKKDFPVTLREG